MDHSADPHQTATPFPTSEGTAERTASGSARSGAATGGTGSYGQSSNAGDDLLNRVVQGAHEAIDRLAGAAAPHVHRLQEQVASAGETLNVKASDVRHMGDEWTESLRSTVREHPVAAMATALAVGMLIARITR